MARDRFTAIESRAEVRAAVETWRAKFVANGEKISGLGPGTVWHERLGIWGHFKKWKRGDGSDRYWNTFGFATTQLRKNMIVEINPPGQGVERNSQGVIARSPDGSRWVLHKGRMSIPGARISTEQFDQASPLQRRAVVFGDGSLVDCLPVTNIDGRTTELQDQVAQFVAVCRQVRLFFANGRTVAEEEARVEAAESSPELIGTYVRGAQGARVVRRRHGEVWRALTNELDKLGAKHTNGRVGRWGPDLRTTNAAPALFEIKIAVSASDLQRAVGQLFLYEKLLGKNHRKILVLPAPLNGRLADSVRTLGLEVVTFTQRAGIIKLDRNRLKLLAR